MRAKYNPYVSDERLDTHHIVGNLTCKPSGYAEFDSLSGYVTKNYTHEWWDREGTKWRTVVTIINLGRPDRGIAVDPEAALAEDPSLFEDERVPYEQWRKSGTSAIRRKGEQRQIELRDKIMAHLVEHGPRHIMGLVYDLELRYTGVEAHIKRNQNILYHAVGRLKRAVLWGVVGVHKEA